jgi:OMF family outer membrane factor
MKTKKISNIKFVNVHKLIFLLLIPFALIFVVPMQAQVWTLHQCIDTAQLNNKTLQMSENNMALSEQKHKEAVSNLIPKIYANADYRYYTDLPTQLMPLTAFGGPEGQYKATQFGVPHNIGVNVQIHLPLYNPQIYGALKTTQIASELSELQYQKTEEQVIFDITNLYYNAQILLKQKSFLESNIVNTKILLSNLQLLNEQLMVKMTDVTKVQLQLEQLYTQTELIKSNYEQVVNALKFTIGIPINQTIQIDTDIQYKERTEYENAVITDIKIAETYKKLINSELKTLQLSRLPALSLYGSYGQTGYGYDEKPNNFLDFYPIGFVGAQLSIPLFNGTVTNKKINQKKIEIQNSDLQLNLLTEQNIMLTDNANRKRTVAVKTIENTISQIELAQTIYNQTVLQQKEGTANLTDVLLSDNALREAQQNYLSAVIDYLKADLELKKLTGNNKLTN